jgi:hypothetical protein
VWATLQRLREREGGLTDSFWSPRPWLLGTAAPRLTSSFLCVAGDLTNMATQLLTFLYTPNGNDKKYLPIAKPIKVHGSEVHLHVRTYAVLRCDVMSHGVMCGALLRCAVLQCVLHICNAMSVTFRLSVSGPPRYQGPILSIPRTKLYSPTNHHHHHCPPKTPFSGRVLRRPDLLRR